jgi:hypothetical protein
MMDEKTVFLNPRSGKGLELCDLLRRELNIPDGVQWFEVRFAVGEQISVKCQYNANQKAETR